MYLVYVIMYKVYSACQHTDPHSLYRPTFSSQTTPSTCRAAPAVHALCTKCAYLVYVIMWNADVGTQDVAWC